MALAPCTDPATGQHSCDILGALNPHEALATVLLDVLARGTRLSKSPVHDYGDGDTRKAG